MRTEMPPSLVARHLHAGESGPSAVARSTGRASARFLPTSVLSGAARPPVVTASPVAFLLVGARRTMQPKQQADESVGLGCAHGGPPATLSDPAAWSLMMITPLEPREPYRGRLGGLLQHLDRLDVVDIDSREVPVGAGIDRHARRGYTNGVLLPPDGRAAPDAYREAARRASASPRHRGRRPINNLFDRLPGLLFDVLRRHGRVGGMRWKAGGGAVAAGLFRWAHRNPSSMRKAIGSKARIEKRDHWTPPMARYDAIYALAWLTANP